MNYFFTRLAQIITPGEIPNVPKGSPTNNTITDALQFIFGVFAAVAVLIVAISAFRIVVSRGNAQDVSKARDAIIYASIGLIISMAAFIIVTFVVESV